MRSLVWFRGKDLRLSDHEPLLEAARGGELIPLFVLDPFFFLPRRARELPHRMQFLLESLASLQKNLEQKGTRLVLVPGKSIEVVPRLAHEWRVDRVLAQRWVEPFARERDRRVTEALHVPFELFEGETLLPPGSLRSGAGTPYAVYTPFAKAHRAEYANLKPANAPRKLPPLPVDVVVPDVTLPALDELGIAHNPRLLPGGEKRARQRLDDFLGARLGGYEQGRDRMDQEATSRLSADLKFGTLSIRSVWHRASELAAGTDRDKFMSELLWREFSHSTLWDRPELLSQPFRAQFSEFPWRSNPEFFAAWQSGNTGYPVVDAAARQLLSEGYVHNRARMIAASFLTKHLLIHYREGEAHYMKYLLDGDWAQNNMGWQWSAGCGADAQPYFRVFNPMTQGEKFDPEGNYVRRYVPELARLPAKFIHAPWEASQAVLDQAGVTLGRTYPRPIVDHAAARQKFLAEAARYLEI